MPFKIVNWPIFGRKLGEKLIDKESPRIFGYHTVFPGRSLICFRPSALLLSGGSVSPCMAPDFIPMKGKNSKESKTPTVMTVVTWLLIFLFRAHFNGQSNDLVEILKSVRFQNPKLNITSKKTFQKGAEFKFFRNESITRRVKTGHFISICSQKWWSSFLIWDLN